MPTPGFPLPRSYFSGQSNLEKGSDEGLAAILNSLASGSTASGWQNIDDSGATQQVLTDIGGGELKLTNDGAGAQTTVGQTLEGVDVLWDTSTNTFDLRKLKGNDVLKVRFDFGVAPTVVPERGSLELRFYSEPGGSEGAGFLVFTLPIDLEDITTGAGVEKLYLRHVSFYVGPFITSGSAELVLVASSGCEVFMRGFFIEIFRKGV